MSGFTIERFARECKAAMAEGDDRQAAASAYLKRTMAAHDTREIVNVLDSAIPAGADIGEMIVHLSPELTMLYGRVPPRFQSGIHNHTVFACIGQLVGREINVFYERDPSGKGLRKLQEKSVRAGDVLELPADAIHSIENPDGETSSALHIYGGDFKAINDERSLWTSVEHEEQTFSFPLLMRESAIAMKRAGNEAGLEALATAVPAMRPVLESLD